GINNYIEVTCYSPCVAGGQHLPNTVSTGCYSTNLTVAKKSPIIPKPVCQKGSIIHTSAQNIGEKIALTDISFELMYFSNRVVGRTVDYTAHIPISAEVTGPEVTGYSLEIKDDLDNVVHTNSFDSSINQIYNYVSNGLNSLGQEVWSTVPYKVKVTEHATDFTWDSEYNITLGNLKNLKLGIGAWVPTV